MTCLDFVDFLIDYYEGLLAPQERAIFDEHLAECSWCRAYLDQYRAALLLSKESYTEVDVGDPPDELIQAILKARPTNMEEAEGGRRL
jgi:predicted anti-sigma-YlaC factor YlaD